jgi:predicted nucleic acid-binding protein
VDFSHYADTSFLVSLYTSDANSVAARAGVASVPGLLFSTLGEVEFSNALALRVFRKEITAAQADRVLSDFRRDIHTGYLRIEASGPVMFEHALLLVKRHTRQLGTRSLDVLHVAAAMEAEAPFFFTFDKSQARLARLAGLTVLPGRQGI